jgi:hypothetical protein
VIPAVTNPSTCTIQGSRPGDAKTIATHRTHSTAQHPVTADLAPTLCHE